MSSPFENAWMRRAKRLTQLLIISITLNVGLIASFAYSSLNERLSVTPPVTPAPAPTPSTAAILSSYSTHTFSSLLSTLSNSTLIEDGLTHRDLALACLVSFHHFNLDKALPAHPLQRRLLTLTHDEQTLEIPVFPGLTDLQFQAITHYANTEKWPLTSLGLFHELKRSTPPYDPTLISAFSLTPEFYNLQLSLSRAGYTTTHLISLIAEGDAALFLQPSPDPRTLLINYLSHRSPTAATLLLEVEPELTLKRLDDTQILILFDLNPSAQATYGHTLATTPRTDAVLTRLAPPPTPTSTTRTHTVQPNENLWKIARKYKVSIDSLRQANNLTSDRLRPGQTLKVPHPLHPDATAHTSPAASP